MDRIRVSETLDTGSIPVGRTKNMGYGSAVELEAQPWPGFEPRALPQQPGMRAAGSTALTHLRSARRLECAMKPRDILIKTFGVASL